MNSPVHLYLGQYSSRERWFLAIAWTLIAVKCGVIWWAMVHWNVPFHPIWIVGPTLMFALLATSIWATHRED